MQYLVSHMQSYTFLILLLVANADSPVRVLSQLNQFDKAPGFTLPKLASPTENIDLKTLDRPVILVFGEPYHQQTLGSLVELRKVYDTVGLSEADLQVFLIFSYTPNEEQMTQLHAEDKIGAEILLDKNLEAFGDYGITVLPSIVVIDKQGRIDLAMSGVPLSFADMVVDAILLSTERITQQQYESAGYAAQKVNAQQKSVTQAHRIAGLAGKLAQRGYTALALERYREAWEIDNTYLHARIGMARCLVKLNLLPDAVGELQRVLKTDADHVEANLILSQIEIVQGGEGIADGKMRLQRILRLNPDHPEANYLMGTVCEAQGEADHALNYYKKAARRLLETGMN
ncbi:MAG: tetratricopeptide repeat protein [Planctomycetota bacterium]